VRGWNSDIASPGRGAQILQPLLPVARRPSAPSGTEETALWMDQCGPNPERPTHLSAQERIAFNEINDLVLTRGQQVPVLSS
jgi:hypothetical protein